MDFSREANRIYKYGTDGERLAEVTFPAVGENLVEIDHTFVSDKLRGQGVAPALMEAAYDEIKRTGRKARLTCSFARRYFAARPEMQDIVAADAALEEK